MKKMIYTLLTVAFVTASYEINSAPLNNQPTELVSTQMSTTEIFNYLNTNLGLTTAQKPVVKKAIDEAGTETTKLNTDASKSATEIKTAKASIVNTLISKLSSGGILNAAQSKKLAGLTSQLTAMFAQLK